MKLLAIETATEACSAAIWIDGAVQSRFEIAPRRHAELILPMCDSLMTEAGIAPAQLDVIAFGGGPGAFTGVRIAVGVAQGNLRQCPRKRRPAVHGVQEQCLGKGLFARVETPCLEVSVAE